ASSGSAVSSNQATPAISTASSNQPTPSISPAPQDVDMDSDDQSKLVEAFSSQHVDDDRSYSKEELQGSSRTTGGTIGGKAVGNAPNIADMAEHPISGKVKIFHSMVDPYNDSNLISRACDVRVTRSLANLLKQVNKHWSVLSNSTVGSQVPGHHR
ncbi:hypothetical protein BDN72DRAFT_899936, partial [Pluteus cervinus]